MVDIKLDSNKEGKLPVFGVGPIYVITCLILTIIALLLNVKGYLKGGEITRVKNILLILGIVSIIFGIWLWIQSVIIQDISKEIRDGKLVTTGVYSIVRNPIYSAFLFLFSGVFLIFSNWYLLILPLIFWLVLSFLMKFTEEIWLQRKFGEEYKIYCKKVNRVIPNIFIKNRDGNK